MILALLALALAVGAFFGWNVGYSRGVRACMPRPRPRADIADVDKHKLGLYGNGGHVTAPLPWPRGPRPTDGDDRGSR